MVSSSSDMGGDFLLGPPFDRDAAQVSRGIRNGGEGCRMGARRAFCCLYGDPRSLLDQVEVEFSLRLDRRDRILAPSRSILPASPEAGFRDRGAGVISVGFGLRLIGGASG